MLDKPSCDFTMITLKQFSKDLKTSLNTQSGMKLFTFKKNQINHSVTDAYLAVCRDILNKNQVSSDTYHSKRFLSIVHLGDNFHHPGVKITSAPSIFALRVHLFMNHFRKSRSSFLSVYSLLTAESLMNACSGNLWILTYRSTCCMQEYVLPSSSR